MIVFLVLCGGASVSAQEYEAQSETLFQWFKGWREYMLTSDMDSGYIDIPQQPWLASINFDVGGHLHGLNIPFDFGSSQATFTSGIYNKVSLGAYYRGWGLSYGHSITNSNATQFTFTSSGQTLGIDFTYQSSNSMRCVITNCDADGNITAQKLLEQEEGNGRFSVLDINAYYVFNSRRFSYSAALGQSAMQMQDAGSFFLGMTYYQTILNISGSLLAQEMMSKRCEVATRQIALGLGYGYNHVSPDKRFLMHGSAMPMLMVPIYNSFHTSPLLDGSIEWNDETQQSYNMLHDELQRYTDHPQLSMLGVIRAAIYWNVTPLWVVGVTGLLTIYPSFYSQRFSTYSMQWSSFAYVGYRF